MKYTNELKKIITKKEFDLLMVIKPLNNEPGHCDFYSWDVKSKSCGGVMANLIKKGLIYNYYVDTTEFYDDDRKPFYMFMFTEKAAKLVGIPQGWTNAGFTEADFE